MTIRQRLMIAAVHVFGRMGTVGERILHRLNFERMVTDTYTRAHAPNCTTPDVRHEPRPQGHVRRCRTCSVSVEVHFSFWTMNGGNVPPEVVTWLADEVKVMVAAGVVK